MIWDARDSGDRVKVDVGGGATARHLVPDSSSFLHFPAETYTAHHELRTYLQHCFDIIGDCGSLCLGLPTAEESGEDPQGETVNRPKWTTTVILHHLLLSLRDSSDPVAGNPEDAAAILKSRRRPLAGAGVLAGPSATYASMQSACYADVCQCIAAFSRELRVGGNSPLLASFGDKLTWATLRENGHRWLVAFSLSALHRFKMSLVPFLSEIELLSPSSGHSESFWSTLTASDTSPAVAQQLQFWTEAILKERCSDFPMRVWQAAVEAAQWAKCCVALLPREMESDSRIELTSESLLLRSFVLFVCYDVEDQSAAVVDGATAAVAPSVLEEINFFLSNSDWQSQLSKAEDLNKAELHRRAMLVALITSDLYWAVFFQPYSAMYGGYYLSE